MDAGTYRVYKRILQEVTNDEFFKAFNIALPKKRIIVCPFHNDSSPSLKVYPANRGWYCFGCGAGGSVVDWLVRQDSITKEQAVLRIAQKFGFDLSKYTIYRSNQRPDISGLKIKEEWERKLCSSFWEFLHAVKEEEIQVFLYGVWLDYAVPTLEEMDGSVQWVNGVNLDALSKISDAIMVHILRCHREYQWKQQNEKSFRSAKN